MTIKAMRLQNFRGFRTAKICLKPLTVLLGPNSAGKSSFGQALAAMSHAHWKYRKTENASLTPSNTRDASEWPVDFGLHRDLVTSGVQDRVGIGLKTAAGWIDFGFGLVPGEPELTLSSIAHPAQRIPKATTEGVNTPSSATYMVVPSSPLPIEGAATGIGEIISARTPDPRLELKRINERNWRDEDNAPIRVTLDGLRLTTAQHEEDEFQFLLDAEAIKDLQVFLGGITYFRAVRKRPERCEGLQIGKESPQKIGYAGDYTTAVLFDKAKENEHVACLFPTAIPNSVDEARSLLDVPWLREELGILPAVGKWMKHLGLADEVESIESPHEKGFLETKVVLDRGVEPRNITEVGFGVSQVLPIIVAGLTQPAGGTLIVELPEEHLHPRSQAQVADFFCSLALSGQSAIVETHSEMFFHRLRLRAAMSADLIDNIAVYFCDSRGQDGYCKPPRRVGLSFDEELAWPAGFLQEAWETEAQINAVREARRTARK